MIKVKSSKRHSEAVEIIGQYANECPKCQSDNIANEDENIDQVTCHDCSHQFSESDYMDKFHIVALLRVKGYADIAEDVAAMESQEFEDFLVNHVY